MIFPSVLFSIGEIGDRSAHFLNEARKHDHCIRLYFVKLVQMSKRSIRTCSSKNCTSKHSIRSLADLVSLADLGSLADLVKSG